MPRVWVDEELDGDPDLWAVGNAGLGLFVRSMTYAMRERTDGWLPASWAYARVPSNRRNPDAEGQIAVLLEYGWWEEQVAGTARDIEVKRKSRTFVVTVGPHKQHGFYVVNFLLKNPCRAEIETEREAKSAGGKRGALSKWGDSSHDISHGLTHDIPHDSPDGSPMPHTPITNNQEEAKASSSTGDEHDDFPSWLAHHEQITSQRAPREGTKARAKVAAMYGARRTEGYSAEDACLATLGAFHDPYRHEHGYYGCESVLRPEKIHDLIEKGGRRAAEPAARSSKWAAWVAEHLPDLEGVRRDAAIFHAGLLDGGGNPAAPDAVRAYVDKQFPVAA